MAAERRNRALLDWYRRHRRSLPWRDRSDPWAVLVAEVMLQQTQVGRVLDRYPAFLEAFPTPAALAAAPLAAALAHWQGLGYPRRLVRLRQAAEMIAADGWPVTAADLRHLPGVGPYTAAAVACFAFGEQVAAVDTNLRRVLSRWLGTPLTGRRLVATADGLLERSDPAAWNQAMMDLGATTCRPRPRCHRCPVTDWCADPGVYLPPRPQAPYRGSRREARGHVLRALVSHRLDTDELVEHTGLDPTRAEEAVATLMADGLVERTARGWAVSDDVSR